jgi:hypothetical protein
MICKTCREEGTVSEVYPGVSETTLMHFSPWYDEKGVYHSHNGNTVTTSYKCSNGHQWTDKRESSPCPGCNWGRS